MNVKKWAPLAMALVLGVVAVKLAMNFLPHHQTQAAAPVAKPVMVVVAKHEIGPAQSLSPDDLDLAPAPENATAADSFSATSEVLGRVTSAPISQGQPITPILLIPKGSHAGLAAILPKGMRAITISITEITGVGGYVQPGCFVDVIEPLGKGAVCLPIVQNVKVTAVGGRLNPNLPEGQGPSTPAGHVTLLVTPDQAMRIQLAVASGQPTLILRGDGDTARINPAGVTAADLVSESDAANRQAAPQQASTTQPAAVVPIVQAPLHTTFMIRGGEMSAVRFRVWEPTTQPTATATTQPDMTEASTLGQ